MSAQPVIVEQIRSPESLAGLSPHSAGEPARMCQNRHLSPNSALRDLVGCTMRPLKRPMLLPHKPGSQLVVGGSYTASFGISKRESRSILIETITDADVMYIDNEVLAMPLTPEQLAAPTAGAGRRHAISNAGCADGCDALAAKAGGIDVNGGAAKAPDSRSMAGLHIISVAGPLKRTIARSRMITKKFNGIEK